MRKRLFVYIMSNYSRTTFYIGVTNCLERRVAEHKALKGSVFTKKYKVTDLVYYEEISGARNAIFREKQLKNWHREWKLNLIKEMNPEMNDLSNVAHNCKIPKQVREDNNTKEFFVNSV